MAGKTVAMKSAYSDEQIYRLTRGRLTSIGLVVVLALVLLTWLYVKSESVNPQVHIEYSQSLRDLREANANTDAELLAGRMELSRNYDALTAHLNAISEADRVVQSPPPFLSALDSTTINVNAVALHRTLQEKERLVELFKRNNAILRNSLTYFQKIANDISEALITVPGHEKIDRYIRTLLFFARTPDSENSEVLKNARQQAGQVEIEEFAGQIASLLQHGDLVNRYQPLVDNQIRDILLLETIRQYEKLEQSYLHGYQNARKTANNFRNILYVAAILLTSYLAYIFISLENARRSLAQAHRETLEHIKAQQRAEERLHLHDTAFRSAHEGITLTDADGDILEVNPAFSRITGYERDEVIGKNPRVLKSGRHDEKFYQVMWDSIIRTGNWRGEIWNRNKYGEIYPEMLSITAVKNIDNEVTNYVAVFADISRIKEQEARLKKMAHYDALTSLPNRVLLIDRINQAIAQSKRENLMTAVCFMDLDGFKEVNDNYGHNAGDDLLIEISKRFREKIRGTDTVARMGGDEFVFLLPGLHTQEECLQSVRRLMKAVSQPVNILGQDISLSGSIGITFYPSDNTDADSLLRHADHAMYQAKKTGKDRYFIFDAEQDIQERDYNERISRIKRALLKNELKMYYQPKADLKKNRIIGMEALIRWIHPDQGLIPPVDFLPLIEEHDLGVEIGYWVLEDVLQQMVKWQAEGIEMTVSVNVAGHHLQDPDFVENLKQMLARYPEIKPNTLELEVLETAALEDMLTISQVIEQCESFGVCFALDDFGTGYSSLTYLKRLPARTLKIDLTFVREMVADPENLAIVHGIMGLATAFQRDVIAEGVETIEHGRMLMQLGCYKIQGYALSRPMPAEDVSEWYSNW